jgi:outer membrane protein OmpA-like peptidoglycan-associated protein
VKLFFICAIYIFSLCNLCFAKKEGTVILDSLPKAISPNRDGLYEKTRFIISADTGKIKKWILEIKNDLGVPIKTFIGNEMIPVALEWDGTDERNAVVPDGKYVCVMTIDGKYPARSNELWVNVDTLEPFVGISVSTYGITPNNDGTDDFVDISFIAEDPVGFSLWQVSIENLKGIEVISKKGQADILKSFRWDGKDDYYKNVVPEGKYKIKFSVLDAVGNKTESEPVEIDVNVREKIIPEVKNISVKEEKRGLVVNLASSVLFDSGKSELKPASYSVMNEVVKLMQDYPENKILIEGHTDSYGSNAYNKKLSEKRAQAVSNVLVSKYAVDSKRLKAVGYGEEKPLADNKTAAGREQNRRVEIIILKK